MTLKHQFLIVWLISLYLSGCVIVETKLKREEFQIFDGDTLKVAYQVEIAESNSARKRGLMYRKSMASNQGMLLDYKRPANMAIWMKNTYIPLDIIFIDINGVILKIHERAVPHSTKRIESDSRVRAVLEVNAGQIAEFDIKPGDQVRHPSFVQ
ncbi:MAG: DUF192 domain-containing protein [Gammaproteobacteria bacterium]|jgi:uncharacterized protein|nr:DUF192 domain-containing protein [Rhodospirillales bacterium]MBT7952829.1 DUF192 domain-containing protein [Gammaproteobacteria bacterium]